MLGNPISNDHCRWIHRDFVWGKLRVRERYMHPFLENCDGDDEENDVIENDTIHWIIPDGLAWRMYLPLIIYLVEREEEHNKQQQRIQSRRRHRCRWVLLESVADWMDYRNMSPTMVSSSS